ncbi:helix-turn-helix domain-containing protein [Salipiger thiooxidans]|uniref:helix-turn-helix domain-containing protein n=1 Tax=Salipiger thiooxidans TaxID=282683 RepID=UPI001CD481F0|nr:helix-turn-helix domain-containing protein [Salipiger thiooxidans]MCA0850241.1 helix-turn-helix domain containing protein [Salipiger thiooxidans]
MPRPAKNLKLEARIEVARRFAAGESAKELAAAFGISPRHVNRLAKEEAGEGIAVRDPSETVAFRASRSELDAFDVEWRARGFANRSQALNAVLRGRCGFLDVPRDVVAEFCAAWRQAKDVSDAGLALAKAVHRGRLEVSEADRSVLIELLDLAQSMSREMGRMKDAAQALRHQEWPQRAEGQGADGAVLEDGPRTIELGLRLVRNG